MPDPTAAAPPAQEREPGPQFSAQKREPDPQPPAPAASDSDLVEADLLVEDVSIDGMCGVY